MRPIPKLTPMVRLGNRTYRTWRITKLTPMVRLGNRTYRPENKTNPVNLVLLVSTHKWNTVQRHRTTT